MPRLFSVSLFPLLAVTNLLAAQVKQKPPAPSFPLMAWDYVDDRATLQAMRDAGITSIAFVRPRLLNDCQEFGLKAIVFDERISGSDWSKPFDGDEARKNLPAVIKEVGNHPALLGFHIKDEPHAREFPELAKAVAAVKELAPGKWPYINLFPGEGESYDRYLEDFVSICAPTAVSYDRYVLGEDGEFGPLFWVNLAQVRDAARKHKLPVWNIVLTAPHWRYRELTPADIRLQVFGSLVYGVSGIAYYKFISAELPILNAPDLGNFRLGPLDQFGEKTATWEWLRNCNRQVHSLAPTYLKLHSDDVYHFGNVPTRNHGPTDKTLVRFVPNGEFVIGDFTHQDGSRYVMLVNKSLAHSAVCKPEFNGTVKALKYVSPISGELKPYPSPYYWLAPGQGVLLRVEF
jgi:hypothetical protein